MNTYKTLAIIFQVIQWSVIIGFTVSPYLTLDMVQIFVGIVFLLLLNVISVYQILK